MRKYNRYLQVTAAGAVEKVSVPTWWDPITVAQRVPFSEFFLFVPPRHDVWDYGSGQRVTGPCWAWIDRRNSSLHRVDHAPASDSDAMGLIRIHLKKGA